MCVHIMNSMNMCVVMKTCSMQHDFDITFEERL
jgi:hypothetical protein